ncbi:nucleoporin GLE1 [Entomortierella parvispora]|uniref:mRNA export factor GLE1 n=1 Tax=Entomortierella parvispora TaxID=205924 RepID=A0A9P3LTW8_9FUNG|nr:nucleoporin GLE1 [Entomortierella parvispora]
MAPVSNIPLGFILGHSLSDGSIDAQSSEVEEFRLSQADRHRGHRNFDNSDEEDGQHIKRTPLSRSDRAPSRLARRPFGSGYGLADDTSEEESDSDLPLTAKARAAAREEPVITSEFSSYVSLLTGRLDPWDMQKLTLQEESRASAPAIAEKFNKEFHQIDHQVPKQPTVSWLPDDDVQKKLELSARKREAAKQRRIQEMEERNKQLNNEIEGCIARIQEERDMARRIREEALQAEQREKERIAKEIEAKKQAAQAQKEAAEKKKKEEAEKAAEQARKLAEAAAGEAAAAVAAQGSDRVSPAALEEWKTYQAILDHIKKTVNPAFKGLAPDIRKWCMNRKRDIIAILGRIVHKQKEVFLVASEIDEIFTDVKNRGGEVPYYWILNFTSKKLINQAGLECLVKAGPAFPLAYAAVLLFGKHEMFLDILMARFSRKCPYTIPIYFKLEKGEDPNEHLKKLGYMRLEKRFENEEEHIKRQNAMFTLYCAIIQTTPQVGKNNYPLSNGWTWLARTLNLAPRNITPGLVATFLDICGNSFLRTYKGQAVKVLRLVHDDILPIIPKEAAPSKARLVTVLETFTKTGDIRTTIQQTVDRFESTGENSRPLSRIERKKSSIHQQQQQQRLEVNNDGDNPPFISKKIDAERVPVQINALETAFVGDVGIGTPPQYFHLQFDVGSADTWIALAKATCSGSVECSGRRRYFHPNRSSTFERVPNVPWGVHFSDNSAAKGFLQTDLLQVGGFVVDRQVIGMATTLSEFKENGIDGSFGLGLSELSLHGDATPVQNLVSTKRMNSEIGIWLGSGNQGGELVFGGKDRKRYTGEMSYFNVQAGSKYWSTFVKSIVVEIPGQPPSPAKVPTPKTTVPEVSTPLTDANSTKAPINLPAGPPPAPSTFKQVQSRVGSGTKQDLPNVIFDTSSNLILLPPRVALAAHQYIHNWMFGWYSGYSYITGAYTIACDHKADVWIELASPASKVGAGSVVNQALVHSNPTVLSNSAEGDVRTRRFKIAGSDLVRERVPVIGHIFNLCYSGIQASKNDEDDWVLGNLFFVNNYITLDHLNRQIGIAAAVRPDLA